MSGVRPRQGGSIGARLILKAQCSGWVEVGDNDRYLQLSGAFGHFLLPRSKIQNVDQGPGEAIVVQAEGLKISLDAERPADRSSLLSFLRSYLPESRRPDGG